MGLNISNETKIRNQNELFPWYEIKEKRFNHSYLNSNLLSFFPMKEINLMKQVTF